MWCVDVTSGQVVWKHSYADGKLVALGGTGELLIAPATPSGFKPTARAQVLGGKCWTAPVLANGRIYCRNSGDQPKTYKDYRELLEKEKPEIVLVATPDHWHALQSIAALRAGAHLFDEFEKFTCVWEHRRFAENNAEKHQIGSYYYGSKGTLHPWQEVCRPTAQTGVLRRTAATIVFTV